VKAAILALTLSAATGIDAGSPGALSATTRFLSSDLLEGRATATRGHEIAALYVATRMQGIGLEPAAGEERWEQPVPLRAWKVDPEGSSLTLHGPAQPPQRLVKDVDFVSLPSGDHSEIELDGALAFVGYGVSAPEYGYDDLKGVDLTGKIAVVLWGAPSSDRPNFFPPAPRAVHADRAGKMARLAARGAAGVVFVYTPEAEDALPWVDFVLASRLEEMGWVEGAKLGDAVDGLPARAVLSLRGLEKVAVAAGVAGGARGILEKAEANRLSAQDWPLKARLRTRSDLRQTRSVNVLGILRGSDPVLAKETVLVTAHLDHLGASAAPDDAVGVAVLLEVARTLAALPVRPARSVLFAAVTGREQGLVGSSYLARHPVVDPAGIVAVLNVDGAPTASPFERLVARGSEHSTLGAAVRSAAGTLGLEVMPDPAPRAGAFARSDLWSFVRVGVPSLWMSAGATGEPPPRPRNGWEAGWSWQETARFAHLQFLVALAVADAPSRPAWNPGDFFEKFGRPASPAKR
jgi:hypothetical protein